MAKKIAGTIIGLILIGALLNIPVTTRQGVNYEVRTMKIPLYIKAVEFIDRDYHYKRLMREIIKDKNTDEAKILAIYKWVTENISGNIPSGWAIYDDHVLNIIIRRYGAPDQISDVLATLATYAGYPSIVYKVMPKNSDNKFYVTLVNLKGHFLIFDPYFKNYFIDRQKTVAAVEYIKANYPHLVPVNPNVLAMKYRGISYIDYFGDLNTNVDFTDTKAYRQLPGYRFGYEIKKKLGNK